MLSFSAMRRVDSASVEDCFITAAVRCCPKTWASTWRPANTVNRVKTQGSNPKTGQSCSPHLCQRNVCSAGVTRMLSATRRLMAQFDKYEPRRASHDPRYNRLPKERVGSRQSHGRTKQHGVTTTHNKNTDERLFFFKKKKQGDPSKKLHA